MRAFIEIARQNEYSSYFLGEWVRRVGSPVYAPSETARFGLNPPFRQIQILSDAPIGNRNGGRSLERDRA